MTPPHAQVDQVTRVIAGVAEERLLNAFFVIYKTARLVDSGNDMFSRQLAAFMTFLAAVGDGSDVTIKRIDERFFVNNRLTRFDDHGPSAAYKIIEEWDMLGVGGVRFHSGFTDNEARHFFAFVADIRPSLDDLDSLVDRLKSLEIPHTQLLSLLQAHENQPDFVEAVCAEFRAAARVTFQRALAVAEEVIAATAHGKEINISRTRRVVHSLVNHILKDESSLVELTAIKEYDDYTYAHSTNVCVYSLTLGARIGLDRAMLSQLGFAALFHDIGKVKLPTDLIRKPDRFDDSDWQQMQQHPILGAKTILRTMRLDAHSAHAARVAFEHHISADFTGYPSLRYRRRAPSLFSRIVAIADAFDALTSGRVYIKTAITPDNALKKMHGGMANKFDTLLLKLFTDVVGIYPAGSLVLLSTDELALVITNNDDNMARPYVKIVGNRQGLLPGAEWADLSSAEHAHRQIVRAIDPAKYGMRASDFILAD